MSTSASARALSSLPSTVATKLTLSGTCKDTFLLYGADINNRALAAGTTIYLACGDVLPALWPIAGRGHSFTPALGVAGGMAFMWLAAVLDHGH